MYVSGGLGRYSKGSGSDQHVAGLPYIDVKNPLEIKMQLNSTLIFVSADLDVSFGTRLR